MCVLPCIQGPFCKYTRDSRERLYIAGKFGLSECILRAQREMRGFEVSNSLMYKVCSGRCSRGMLYDITGM